MFRRALLTTKLKSNPEKLYDKRYTLSFILNKFSCSDGMDRALVSFNITQGSMVYLAYEIIQNGEEIQKGTMLKFINTNIFNMGHFLIELSHLLCVTRHTVCIRLSVYLVTLNQQLLDVLNEFCIPSMSKLISKFYNFHNCMSDKNLIKTEASNVNLIIPYTVLDDVERRNFVLCPYPSVSLIQKIPKKKRVARNIVSTYCFLRTNNTKRSEFKLNNIQVIISGIRVIFHTDKAVNKIFQTMDICCGGFRFNDCKTTPEDWVVIDKLLSGVESKDDTTCTCTFIPQSSSLLINGNCGEYRRYFDPSILKIQWTSECAKDIRFSVELLL